MLAHVRRVGRHFRFVGIVQQRQQRVVIGVRDRIVLVRVTLRTAGRQSHPDGSGRRDTIDHRIEAILQRIDATFFVQHRVAMKTGGDALAVVASGNMSPASCSIEN